MIFDHIQEIYNKLFILYGNDIVQILLDIWEYNVSRCLYGSTVCNGHGTWQGNNLSRFQGCLHAGCIGRLHTDDLNVRIQHFGQSGYSCCQSASTDRHKNDIHCRQFLKDLHRNGALSGCHRKIIERMHKCHFTLLGNLQCFLIRLVIDTAIQHNLCTIASGTVYLDQRGCRRHYDHRLCSKQLGCIGNTLCVITGRSCDQSMCQLLLCQCTCFIISSSHLICPCILQILRL